MITGITAPPPLEEIRAVVRAVRPDRAIAEPVPEFMRGVVQRGDKVTTRLKA